MRIAPRWLLFPMMTWVMIPMVWIGIIPKRVVRIGVVPSVMVRVGVVIADFVPKVDFSTHDLKKRAGIFSDFLNRLACDRSCNCNFAVLTINLRVQKALMQNNESPFRVILPFGSVPKFEGRLQNLDDRLAGQIRGFENVAAEDYGLARIFFRLVDQGCEGHGRLGFRSHLLGDDRARRCAHQKCN